MKVAILGSSGYIAGYIIKRFFDVNNIDSVIKIDVIGDVDYHINLCEPEKFDYNVLKEIDYVIFTAAISGPDQCAKEFDMCWSINVLGTEYFIENAIKQGCRVLFFSSDAVFGDIQGEIYTENSETKAETAYGRMKKHVEDTFSDNESFKAIRLSYVVSAKDRFVSYCINCIKNKCEADIFHPFYRNCITVSDVVEVVLWFVNNWNTFEGQVLNVAGIELVSRVRIADEINRLFNNKLKYRITVPDSSFFNNRPSVTQMKSNYLLKYGILIEESFTEKIRRELEDVQL